MKKMTLFIMAGLLVVTCVGCGTVRGFGDDISTVGHWITRNQEGKNFREIIKINRKEQ